LWFDSIHDGINEGWKGWDDHEHEKLSDDVTWWGTEGLNKKLVSTRTVSFLGFLDNNFLHRIKVKLKAYNNNNNNNNNNR